MTLKVLGKEWALVSVRRDSALLFSTDESLAGKFNDVDDDLACEVDARLGSATVSEMLQTASASSLLGLKGFL